MQIVPLYNITRLRSIYMHVHRQNSEFRSCLLIVQKIKLNPQLWFIELSTLSQMLLKEIKRDTNEYTVIKINLESRPDHLMRNVWLYIEILIADFDMLAQFETFWN